MAEPQGKLYIEKRKHTRIIKEYNVRYKLMPKNISDHHTKLNGKSLDISTGGIRIEGEIVGEEGDVIKVEIDSGNNDYIALFAEIRWIKRQSAKNGQLGLQFLALREEDTETIKKIIANGEKQ